MPDPTTVLTNLAEVLYDHERIDDISNAVCISATLLIPGCDHASLMVRENGRFATIAASDYIAADVDRLERELNEGPCVDAIETESPQIESDLSVAGQWPALAKAVLASTPVRSAMAFRIKTGNAKSGALNLFGDEPGAFGPEAIDQAVIVAAFASVLVGARSQKEQAETLRSGLLQNREIGKAIGLLMAIHNISDDEAFGLLSSASQRANTKLSELARRLVTQHREGLPARESS